MAYGFIPFSIFEVEVVVYSYCLWVGPKELELTLLDYNVSDWPRS
jgi:hypothetical protein